MSVDRKLVIWSRDDEKSILDQNGRFLPLVPKGPLRVQNDNEPVYQSADINNLID